MALQKTQLKIEGMTCGHCSKTVTNCISSLPGVEKVEVSLQNNTAEVSFEDSLVNIQQIIDSVNATEIYKAHG